MEPDNNGLCGDEDFYLASLGICRKDEYDILCDSCSRFAECFGSTEKGDK
jgi:hypothetical protein